MAVIEAAPQLDPQLNERRALLAGRIVVLAVSLALTAVLARVLQLELRPEPRLAALVDTQQSTTTFTARRGSIRDRYERDMVVTTRGQILFADTRSIGAGNFGTFSDKLGGELWYDPAWIRQQLEKRPNSRYVVLDKELSPQRLAMVQKIKIEGLGVAPMLDRHYPHGITASQVLGFVGAEGQGLEGMERRLESKLRGQDGSMDYLRDAARRPLWVNDDGYQLPTDGQTLDLTLDLHIQNLAEQQLAKACTDFSAKSGELVVMDPVNGEILAMASWPPFDPNYSGKSKPEQRRNRCVTDSFEPGSTFKPFIWAAALEQRLFRPGEVFDCGESGVYHFPSGRNLRDASAHGRLTGDDVLVYSSNIGMGLIGHRMERDRLFRAVRAFGFGNKPGSELPGEIGGIVNPLKKWTSYSLTSLPMGQEIAVTPLQITRAFCAIANGGMLVRPTILLDHPEQTIGDSRVFERVLSRNTALYTQSVLRRVVTEGTGRKANSKLYSIFGKTGTAQVPSADRRGYEPDAYVGAFIAGAPLENPRLVAGCFIHRPDRSKGHFGGTVAAPAVKAVMEEALLYLGVTPIPPTDTPTPQQLARAGH